MQTFLALIIVLFLSNFSAHATTYSCRDQHGQLHVADNIQALPQECQMQEKEQLKTKTPSANGTFNMIPAKKSSANSSNKFQRAVDDATNEQLYKKARTKKLLAQAENLLNKYKTASRKKRSETKRWSYNSRAIIKDLDVQIEKIRREKEKLLASISNKKLIASAQARIITLLNEINDK